MEHGFLVYNENWVTAVTEQETVQDEDNRSSMPSIMMKSGGQLRSDYQIFHEMVKGAKSPYNIGLYEDDEDMACAVDNFADLLDDSTTDEDSMFYSMSQEEQPMTRNGNVPLAAKNNFYSCWKQFEEEMALSQDWKGFLN